MPGKVSPASRDRFPFTVASKAGEQCSRGDGFTAGSVGLLLEATPLVEDSALLTKPIQSASSQRLSRWGRVHYHESRHWR